MTSNKNLESQPQIYPQYVNAYSVEDEISLVDLWISLIKFKRVFVISFFVFLVLAVLVITVFKTNKYNLTTTISIGQIEKSNEVLQLQSPSSVINNLNISLIPRLTKKMAEDHGMGFFKTTVSNPKDTNLITISNRVTESSQEVMAGFQTDIIDAILEEHLQLSILMNTGIQQELVSEKLALEELKNPRQLVKLTDLERLTLEEEKIELVKLTDKDYLKSRENEFSVKIQIYKDRIRALVEKNDALHARIKMTSEGYEKELILGLVTDNEIRISENKEQQLNIEKEFIDFKLESRLLATRQRTLVDSIESEIALIESNWKADIKKKESKIIELENRLKSNNTRVISRSDLSLNPVGLTQGLAYVIGVILSIFGAFTLTLIAMFRAKVNERLAEET